MLAKRTGNIKDIPEAEKQLSETQTELDSIQGRRKALANETEMVAIEVKLRTQSLSVEGSWLAPVVDAGKDAGHVLMSSLGSMMTLLVGLLPWLILLASLAYLIRRFLIRRSARKV